MQKYKPIKKETYYDKYCTTIVYTYRDHDYEVTYSNSINYCTSPAWIQHRDAQQKIDNIIDNPTIKNDNIENVIDLDDIWSLMGWN